MKPARPGPRQLGLRALEIACWATATVLLVLYLTGRAHGEAGRREAIAAFAQASEASASAATTGQPEAGPTTAEAIAYTPGMDSATDRVVDLPPDQSDWSSARIRAYRASTAEGAMAEALPLAVLRIPRLRLEVPVFGDVGERNLNRGAGWVEGTAAPGSDGNVAIAAHRDGYFRVLREAAVGDVLELESRSDRRSYRISELAIVEPTDVSSLDPTDLPSVTLVTCYPFQFVGHAPLRYIVRAVAEQ